MKRVRQMAIGALLASSALLLTGCIPAGLLPEPRISEPRPTAAPAPGDEPESFSHPDDGGDGGDDYDLADNGQLYNWSGGSGTDLWNLAIYEDGSALGVALSEDGFVTMEGSSEPAGAAGLIATLSPNALLAEGEGLDDVYVLTIADVNAVNTTMTIVKNGTDLGTVDVALVEE